MSRAWRRAGGGLRPWSSPRSGREGAGGRRALARHPDADGECLAGKTPAVLELQAGVAQPAGHLVFLEAEPAMLVFAAQVVQIVGLEVDDEETPARPPHARRLLDRARRPLSAVKQLMDGSSEERRVGKEGVSPCRFR